MGNELVELQERRRLLAARASMQRLEVSVHLAHLREGSRKSLSAAALVSSPAVRSTLVTVATFALGRTRLAGAVRIATLAYVAFRVMKAVATREKAPPPP
jgi:hypothetical protein